MYNVFMMCLDITPPPLPLLLVTVEIVMMPPPPALPPPSCLLILNVLLRVIKVQLAAQSPQPGQSWPSSRLKTTNGNIQFHCWLIKFLPVVASVDVLINILVVELSKYVSGVL